jgi:hypothetical protein
MNPTIALESNHEFIEFLLKGGAPRREKKQK